MCGCADRLAELGDDDLLGLGDRVERRPERERRRATTSDGEERALHCFTSCLAGSRLSSGRIPFIDESTTSFRPVFGSTSFSVSRYSRLRVTSGRLAVLVVDVDEAGDVAARVVDALERVALRGAHDPLGLAARVRHGLVVVGPRLVDEPLLLLDRLVDLVERRLDRDRAGSRPAARSGAPRGRSRSGRTGAGAVPSRRPGSSRGRPSAPR